MWFISSLLLFSCGFYLYYRWFYVVCKHFFQKKLYNPKDININLAYHVIILNYIRRYYNKIMKRRALKAAFPRTIPIMTGFIFLGMAYGIYMNASGFSFIYPFFMSMLIFGGSLEFVCVEMLLSPFAPVQVLIMAVMIQARHLFYGLSMLDKFKGLGWKKYYLIFGMCDETFSVNYISEIPEDVDRGWFYFFVTLLNQFYWVASATIGGIIGSLLKFDTSGISFVMTAMFVVIFLDQWMKEKIHVSSMIGILVSLVCLILFGADSFMIPTMILIVLLLTVLRKWLEQCDKLKAKEEPTK